jgi:hypothetical protein
MTKTPIPPQVRRFVLTSIPSVPHLEALMLLRATAPLRWNAANLASRLYIPPARAGAVLDDLIQAGIALGQPEDQTCCYEARSPDLAALVDQLAAFYSSHLVELTTLIHSRLDRKAQQFADAFDFRKDP